MFAVSGHVNRPGVFEVPNGITTFRELFEAPEYCGGIRDGRKVKAFIPGGASAMWFFEEHLDLPLDKPTVDKAGSMLGSGAIVVMDETTDMVKACWRIVRFFARESCGKCTPCREGTTWLERILARILDGHGRPEDLDLLLDVSDNISPGHRLAAAADHDLPARARRRCRRSPRPSAASATSSSTTSSTAVPSTASSTASRPVSDAPSATTDRRRGRGSGQDHAVHHRRRAPARGPPGQLVIDACEDAGRLRPALLLPPAHEPGRHVPAVPRRGRGPARTDAGRVVHDAGGRRPGRPHRHARR